MAGYLTKRVAQMVVTLFLFLTVVFFLIQSQPGDFASFFALGPGLPPDTRERLQEKFGTDKPLLQQYAVLIRNYATGDFGVSFKLYPRSVLDVIKERLPRTLMLFVTSAVLSFYLGFAAGKYIAWRRGGPAEYVATLGGVALYTVFTPWFALMIIWLLAFKLDWFPIGSFLDPLVWRDATVGANEVFGRMLATIAAGSAAVFLGMTALRHYRRRPPRWVPFAAVAAVTGVAAVFWTASGLGNLATDILWHMALPVLTLTLISFAGTMLLTRNSMLEVMREDFVLAARAKGLPDAVVRDRHVARNALLPVVTSLVLSFAFAVDGGVIIESVFSWPGMGRTLVDAVTARDLPLAVGAFVFTGVFVLLAHLAADILHTRLDPRLRHR